MTENFNQQSNCRSGMASVRSFHAPKRKPSIQISLGAKNAALAATACWLLLPAHLRDECSKAHLHASSFQTQSRTATAELSSPTITSHQQHIIPQHYTSYPSSLFLTALWALTKRTFKHNEIISKDHYFSCREYLLGLLSWQYSTNCVWKGKYVEEEM